MTVKMKWETIENEHAGYISRARTPTGWLVCQVDDVLKDLNGQMQNGYEWRSALTFVLDPDGTWLAEQPKLNLREHMWDLQAASTNARLAWCCRLCREVRDIDFASGNTSTGAAP